MTVKWHTLWNGLIHWWINIHQSIGGIGRWHWCTDMWGVVSSWEVQVQLALWWTSMLQSPSWLTRTHCCGNWQETPPQDWHVNSIATLTSHYTPCTNYSPSPSQACCWMSSNSGPIASLPSCCWSWSMSHFHLIMAYLSPVRDQDTLWVILQAFEAYTQNVLLKWSCSLE